MAYNPGVSFFISFHELDPSKESQCIFFTQKGARCRWSCQESDNRRAIALHKTINAISSEAFNLDLLQEYVLCNCCRSGRARHRDRIEDIGLLIPLARRWQDEIWRHAADQFNHTTSVAASEENIFTTYGYTTPATPTPSHTTTLYTPTAGRFYYQPNVPTPLSINATPSQPIASSPYYQYGSPRSSTTTEFALQPFQSQPRYDLRPREANISTNSTSTKPTSISQPPLSEFRPHIADPLPSDSVSWKILDPLEGRDFETGSLYIFNRASSPGHVKIGWTAGSISGRLQDWSKCGYNPNLLFNVCWVPHAQRVETLTHYELVKEWRRERMCKAPWCRKSHQEWFEISEEQAAQVLRDWADFMEIAEPYDSEGQLKNWWREVVEMMDGNGEVVTAKKLLEHYEESLVEEATLVEEPVEPTWPKETPLLKSEALPEQIPLVEISFPKAEKQPKSDQLFKTKPLPKTEPLLKTEPLSRNEPLSQTQPQYKSKPPYEKLSPAKTTLFNTEPLPKTQFLFTAQPPFKIGPLSKTGPLFKAESLFRTEPVPKSEPVREEVSAPETTPGKELPPEQIPLPPSPLLQSTTFPKTGPLFKAESLFRTEPVPKREPVREEVSAPETTPVKELPREQIPLPPSPLLQSTTFPQDILPSQETKLGLRTGTEETSAVDIIANSDANITVVDTLPSTTPSEDIPPQTSTHTSTDNNTTTNSPPLNFSDSSAEPNSSDSSATSTSTI